LNCFNPPQQPRHKVKDLYVTHGVSTVLVIGGCGDYFDVADTVVAMESYEPRDVTARAKAIAAEIPSSLGDSQLSAVRDNIYLLSAVCDNLDLVSAVRDNI
jgi:hypothetical protein